MSLEYTPTTDDVRAAFFVWKAATEVRPGAALIEGCVGFDRWLAGEIRKAKVEAWEVGFSRGFYKAQVMPSHADASEATTPNPYEAHS